MTLNSFSFLVFFAGTLLLLWILKLLFQKNRHFPVILRLFLVIAGYLFIAHPVCLVSFSFFPVYFFSGSPYPQISGKKEAAYDFWDPGSTVFSGVV